MSRFDDEDERLGMLLRALPCPEPAADFLGGARRRYLEAMEARYRREAVRSVLGAAVALGLVATLLLSAFEPLTLVVWIAVTMASLARYVVGIGAILSLVPPVVWTGAVLLSLASLLSITSLGRVRVAVAVGPSRSR